MVSTSNLFCRQLIDLLKTHGVKTAYCCPGSRNTPLLVALDACEEISKRIVIDERSAAFQALGCGLIERAPVAIVCTSGSAVLDCAPAIAEAYYAGIPLILISADRPKEWIDQDDSQTIRQFGIIGNILKGSYDLRAIPAGRAKEYPEDVRWTVNRTVNEALLNALDGKPGPVHINIQLADPLGDISDEDESAERSVVQINRTESVPTQILNEMASVAVDSRIMVVAGFSLPDHRLDRAVRELAGLPNVTVMAETLANLHDPQPLATMVDAVLCDMTKEEMSRMRPDIVISIGGALVSRMLKQYLRDFPPGRHWSVGHANYFCDCFKSLTDRIDIAPESFIRQLAGAIRKKKRKISSDYSEKWFESRKTALAKSERYINESPWTDLKAYDYIFKNLKFDNLFLSNGTSVRYSQLIPHSCHAEYCNRGVSGIDGCTSTAVGAAWSYPGETMLLSGDMSWIYDSGASALHNVPPHMHMIVVDNSGGGIFRFVKSTSSLPEEMLEKYFCVNDLPDIEAVAAAYGIETMMAIDMRGLEEGVAWISERSDFPRLLIVKTPAEESARVLKNYFIKSK